MSRPVFNAGHYTHASGFEYQQEVFDQEARERLLAIISRFGISSGFGFSDVSTTNNPSIRIAPGLAFDGSGRTIRLTVAQKNAGMSTLTGLTPADINKIMVVENALSGVMPEAHPIAGVIKYTRYVDYPLFSVVASGDVDTTKHVRIGRFYDVVEGPTASVAATSINGRDVLAYPKSSPFVVVGPTGDGVADYTGEDATPFNEAIGQLAAVGGGTILVRPGAYAIDTANPIEIDGIGSVTIVGYGQEATVIQCLGAYSAHANPHIDISNCGDVSFENLHLFQDNGITTVGDIMRLRNIDRFLIRGAKLTEGNASSLYIVSGITWMGLEGNVLTGFDDIIECAPVLTAAQRSKHLHIRGNRMRGIRVGGEFENVIIDHNQIEAFGFSNGAQISLGDSTGRPISIFKQPARAIVAENEFLDSAMVFCAASGAIIKGNTFEKNQLNGLAAIELYDFGTNGGDDCIVTDNVINNPVSGLNNVIVIWTDRCIVRGNILRGPGPSGPVAVSLAPTSRDCIVDDNITKDYYVGFNDEGSSNWLSSGVNNTSNKDL